MSCNEVWNYRQHARIEEISSGREGVQAQLTYKKTLGFFLRAWGVSLVFVFNLIYRGVISKKTNFPRFKGVGVLHFPDSFQLAFPIETYRTFDFPELLPPRLWIRACIKGFGGCNIVYNEGSL